jgi:hypothetical protein
MNIKRFKEVKTEILQANKAFLLTADIRYIGWLTRKRPDKAMSSIVIEFIRLEDVNRIIKEELV